LLYRSNDDPHLYYTMNSEYIKAIADKLDKLKAASGEINLPKEHLGHASDPFMDQGNAAIAYLKKIGKWPINGG
jgi:hypothetical protein